MNQNEKTTIDILKEAISEKEVNIDVDIDLNQVIQEMQDQAVLPMGFYILHKKGLISEAAKPEYERCILNQVAMWYLMLEAQNQIMQVLVNKGHQVAIMKGFANAVLYPIPSMRTLGDIDILVRQEDFEEIFSLLLENGYSMSEESVDENHHIKVNKEGVQFEIHKRPAGTKRYYSKENEQLIDYFQEGLSHAEIIELEGYTFPVLDPIRNGLMLLLHTAAHMQSGIGIRHALDWALFADSYLDDEMWGSNFREICEKNHVDKLAKILTRISQQYFGVGEHITWCISVDAEVCDALMDYMVSQGDFGRKAGLTDVGVKLIIDSTGKEGVLHRFNKSCQYSMPLIAKYPILKPIGWLYQVCRYIYKIMKRKYGFKSFIGDLTTSRQRRNLFETIGIQDWRDD